MDIKAGHYKNKEADIDYIVLGTIVNEEYPVVCIQTGTYHFVPVAKTGVFVSNNVYIKELTDIFTEYLRAIVLK